MSISSSLELFSLADVFRLIESDNKSGRLTIQTSLSSKESGLKRIYYIWFQDGDLVAVSDRLNHKGLISLIEARGWLSPLVTNKLRTLCPIEVPLGIYLQNAKLLTSEQINLIFQIQLHQVYQLFELTSGLLRFDEMSELKDRIMTIPWLEMTGNRIKATEASIYALRLIKDWDIFADQLPTPNLIFKRLVPECQFKLMSFEWQVWQQIDGLSSLNTIAKHLNKSIKSVQIAAFRLLAVGLVEEIMMPSLTLERIQPSSSSNTLMPLNIKATILNPEPLDNTEKNSHEVYDDRQKQTYFSAEETKSNSAYPQPISQETTSSNSLLSNLIGLLRNQF